jgi:WD40 repeat protein/beta-lactamase regulating signal transducer with metallopeptidase domain
MMSFPESFLTGASWAGVAVVQVTLAALLGLLAWLMARRGGPALRGAVLLAVLVGLLFLPGLAVLAPTWLPLPECVCPARAAVAPVPVAPRPIPVPVTTGGEASVLTLAVVPSPARDRLPPTDVKVNAVARLEPLPADEAVLEVALVAAEPVAASLPREQPEASWPIAAVLSGLWLLGALFCGARSLRNLAILYRCCRRARAVADPEWTDAVAAAVQRDGLPPVALKESPLIRSPITLGLFRPVILLPVERGSWSARERRLILEHELAHIRRRDFLAGLVVELVVCLCWFHPLVRWLASRLRLEQEYAADAWVASVANDSRDYIRCLARLALLQSKGAAGLAPALWRRRPEILRRIDMLQNTPRGAFPGHVSRRAGFLVAAFTAAALLAVAGVGPLSSAAPKPGQTEPAKVTEDPQGDPLPAGALARLGTTRLRHKGDVTFVAFVGDGKVLTAGKDNTVRLWDLASRKEIHRFTRPTAAPKPAKKDEKAKAKRNAFEAMMLAQSDGGGSFRVAVTADGKILAVAGPNVIQLWDLESGKELRKIDGPGNVAGLIFSPDGRTLAARAGDETLFLWSAESGKELHRIKPAPAPRRDGLVFALGGGGGGATPAPGLAFTPDGKHLVASVRDFVKDEAVRSVKFFDVKTGKEARKIEASKGTGVSSIAVSRDGKLLAYGAGGTVRICAAESGKEIHKIPAGDGVHMLVFAPDSKTLAVRGLNQRVRLWDAAAGKELRQLNDAELPRRGGGGFILFIANGPAGAEVRALGFSPDGKRIASAAGSTIRVWETATGKETTLVESHWRSPSLVVVSRDGKTAVTWSADRVVRRWDTATGKSLGEFAAPKRTVLAAFSPDGRTVALANGDNTIRLHDTATGKELSKLNGPGTGTFAMTFAPGGKVLAVRGNGPVAIHLYDLANGKEYRQLASRPKNERPQGNVFFIGGVASGPNGTGPGVAFSPDGKLVAAPVGGDGGRSRSIVFFDSSSGKELRKIESERPIASFAFAPDSRTLATENADGTVSLWEVASAKERVRYGKPVAANPPGNGARMTRVAIEVDGIISNANEPGGPVGVAFSPDGRALAVLGPNRAIRVLDVANGKQIVELKGHEGRPQTVAFAANGKALASGGNDTTVLLWDAAGLRKDLSKVKPVPLTPADVESLWGELAGTNAAKAHQGIQKLVAGAEQSVPFLSKQLEPVAQIDPKKIDRWLADLDSEKFSVRQEATTNLMKAGEQAVPPLKKLLASGPQLETRKRAEELVDRLTGGVLTTEQLRVVRAVEALEQIGTAEALRLLKTLAGGGPGALTTREAQAALDRLAKTRP